MPKGVYEHKSTEKTRASAKNARQIRWSNLDAAGEQSKAMQQHWEDLSAKEKVELGARISTSLTGKKQSEEHRKSNSESHKGHQCSEETRRKLSEAGKRAYAEGRKHPVCSTSRKGTHHTEEAKVKIREARKSQIVWNTGMKTGPRDENVRAQIADALRGKERHIPKDVWDGAKKKNALAHLGRTQSETTRRKRSDSLRRAFAEGRAVISPKTGYGKRSQYESPFQGLIWLRSSSELQRARELDALGETWFYEVQRFSLLLNGKSSTYTPDFWILPSIKRDQVPQNFKAFLGSFPVSEVRIEDVKGWWKPNHKSYSKIESFRTQHPEIQLQIVVREGIRE